jgi:hypothetical protein
VFPLHRDAIPPGLYVTSVFRPQLRLELGGGWRLVTDQTDQRIELARLRDAPDLSLNFYVVDQVIDPAAHPANSRDVSAAAQHLAPTNAVAWLQGHPGLKIERPSTASRSGTAVDFSVIPEKAYHYGAAECARTPCVLLFRSSSREKIIAAYQGDANRFYFLPRGKQLVVATISGPLAQLERLLPQAEAIVNSALR